LNEDGRNALFFCKHVDVLSGPAAKQIIYCIHCHGYSPLLSCEFVINFIVSTILFDFYDIVIDPRERKP
ncbi:hypothetical protein ACUODJ_44590, partial [Escherichia sp. HC-CC]